MQLITINQLQSHTQHYNMGNGKWHYSNKFQNIETTLTVQLYHEMYQLHLADSSSSSSSPVSLPTVRSPPDFSMSIFRQIRLSTSTVNQQLAHTRKLSYRKDDRAMRPMYRCPENF